MSTHSEFLQRFHSCEQDLRAFIGSLIRDVHSREDVFQEVSRTLWEKFDDYDLSYAFGAWARGIAARKLLELRRRDARFPLVYPPEAVAAILEAFDATDGNTHLYEAALRNCLTELPLRARHILKLRYDQRLPCDRIARETGSTLKAIHQTLCRLRRTLHDCIQRRIDRDEMDAPEPVTNPSLATPHE